MHFRLEITCSFFVLGTGPFFPFFFAPLSAIPVFFLPLVLKNFWSLLGDEWNFHLFINERVRAFLRQKLPDFHYKWTPIQAHRLTTDQYSSLLRQRAFWEQVREETVLVFQADCLLLHPIPAWAERFDMIGAPCGTIGDGRHIYNGGLSVRSRRAMLSVALKPDQNGLERRPEDVFFTEELRKIGANLPDLRTAHRFATEDVYSTHPIGIHGTDKYYS